MEELARLFPQWQQIMWGFGLVFLRVGAIVSFIPVFGEQSIPARVRLAIAFTFSAIVYPAIVNNVPMMPTNLMGIIKTCAPEVIAGIFFGLLLRFFVIALQTAGSIAAQSTSLSQIFGGTAGADAQPAIGHVLVISGLALAAVMGLHVEFARYMIHGYTLVPLGVLVPSATVSAFGLATVSQTFALGFTLAAPFVLASLIYNVTLGIINKAMPQLMVSFVGAPAITAGGLFLLFVTAPIMLSIWIDKMSLFIMSPETVIP